MSNSSSQDHQSPNNDRKRLWLLVLKRGGIALGGILLLGLIGGAWRLWIFVQKELTPLAEKSLTTTLNRPVKLGKVTQFSLTGVSFGASAIPATPTDPDKVEVDAVEVAFNPFLLIFNRQLKLDVTLVNPDAYIEQDDQGRWITTTLAPPGAAGAIKTDLDTLRFRNGNLVLLPHPEEDEEIGGEGDRVDNRNTVDNSAPIVFSQVVGSAQLLENNQLVKFTVQGQADTGGKIAIQGDVRPKTLVANLQLQVEEILAPNVTRLVKLPLDLQTGRVNGDLQIQLAPEQRPLLFGSADLEGVTLQIPRTPQAFINSQGNIYFQGTEIKLENLTTNYGKIPLVASGIIDSNQGYRLAGRINSVSVANAQETLKLKLPVPVAGQLQAKLQLLGKITQPILSGTVTTVKTARIDKINFKQVSSKFEFNAQDALVKLEDIQGETTLGGEIQGGGIIQLGENPQINLNFAAKQVPGDAIAKLYNPDLAVKIGTVNATARVSGTPTNAQTLVQFAAPEAIYPTTGEVIVGANRNYNFRNVVARVAGGTVRGYGSFVNQRWQAVAQATGVSLQPFVNQNQLQNVSLAGAELNGRFILSGTAEPFQVGNIRAQDAGVQIGGGRIAIASIQLQDKNFTASLVANNVRLGRILKNSLPALANPLDGTFQIAGNRENFNLKTLQGNGEARLRVGNGTITASNIQLANGRYQALVQANNVPVQRLAAVPLQGNLTGQLDVAGSVDTFSPKTIQARGQASINVGNGTITASNIQLANGRYQALVQANNVPVQRLAAVPLQGDLTGQLDVAGSVDAFSPKTIQARGQASINVGNGTITASNIQLANGRYQGLVQANNVPVQRLAAVPLQGDLTGQLDVAGSVDAFSPKTIQARGQASINVGNGTITASNIQLANGRYQALVQANNVPVQRLATVPPQFQGNLTGQLNVAGGVDSFNPKTIQARGQAQLNVAGGNVILSNIQLANGRYQTAIAATGVELNRFNQQLRGQLGGQLQLAGNLGSTRLADVQAAGQVQLSQGLPGIERPLTASLAWNGDRLTIQQATAPGLNISGDIAANATRPGIPEITALNLNVQAQDFNLQQLPVTLPNQVAVTGRVDFNGRVTGKLPLPNVAGQLALKDLAVQGIAFEPLLTGSVRSGQGQGLNLDLRGNNDRIALNLNANNRPESFLIRWQQALAQGQVQGDNWGVKVANFPLQILNVSPPPSLRLGTGKITGLLTGDVQFNQRTFATTANLAIANPELGRIKGDRFAAQFRYSDGTASITNSEFIKGNSRYALAGNIAQTSTGPRVQGKLNISQGNIQDVLTVAQIFDFQDLQNNGSVNNYGNAEDLTTYSLGLPNRPLLDQLKRLYEIDALIAGQEEQRNASPIPELADLQGTFSGNIALDTATPTGLSVQFNLSGQDFTWGQETQDNRFYRADKIIAEGSFENGVLQLRPLRIESANSLVAFAGNIGGADQSGQLRVSNFPLEVLNNFVKLPIGITGNLSGTAALAGSVANPQARGELQITSGKLNQKPIESANASFSYANGRLNFGSTVSVAGPEPVNINGSIPYKLPFATTNPESDQISLDVKVQNEGLALLNLLTNQIAFETGEGEIDLTVKGTRQKPIVSGTATIQDATFSAQALPGKLRDVTGRVQFDFDRILVENLQGKFSRGKVEASGEIPIFNNELAVNNPLNVNLDQLALNLKGLYQGGASGNLQITGSALNPAIGGKISLYDGQVLLAESSNTEQNNSNVGISFSKLNKQDKQEANGAGAIARFNNLELELGKNLQITRQPILSFRATGNLTVNGTFADPIPVGTIQLKDGGVNLFTTQFKLARGYKNTATFRANQPRDPDLDVQLFAKVLDVVQNSDFSDSRLSPTGLAALETVRVEANVKGQASRLNESLELRSSPSRSENEIVALLGGGFVNTQGRGDSTLGIINIAGSAVFNNFQSTFTQIGNAFGLSELRIFPTIISDNPEAGKSSSNIELAAEAGIDLSTKLSISSIKILTANDPFQWGLNYRINDKIRVRASTNLEDDSRAVIEYQTRF